MKKKLQFIFLLHFIVIPMYANIVIGLSGLSTIYTGSDSATDGDTFLIAD
jgi:hypothetical protein